MTSFSPYSRLLHPAPLFLALGLCLALSALGACQSRQQDGGLQVESPRGTAIATPPSHRRSPVARRVIKQTTAPAATPAEATATQASPTARPPRPADGASQAGATGSCPYPRPAFAGAPIEPPTAGGSLHCRRTAAYGAAASDHGYGPCRGSFTAERGQRALGPGTA